MIYIKTKEEFQNLLAESGGKKVVVDFTASWCGPCRFIGPKFDKFADQYPDVIAAKVDVDEASEVAEQQGITAMPTFKLYVDGKEIKEVCGASEHAVEDLFKN